MWLVANKTPFAADYAWVLDQAGNKIWLVVVKATFAIGPDGSCHLTGAESQCVRWPTRMESLGKAACDIEAGLAAGQSRRPTFWFVAMPWRREASAWPRSMWRSGSARSISDYE